MKLRPRSTLVLFLLFAAASTPTARAADPPTGPLRLCDALAAALVDSPDLAVFSWELRAKEAHILQAGLLPNPELAAEVEDFGGSGDRLAFEQTQVTISISQLIELGGKRAKRLRLATLDRDLAAWDYEVTRANVITAATKAFTATLAAQEREKLFTELLAVARRSVEAVSGQVHAGATSPVEVLRAEAAAGRTETQRSQADRELANARAALAATWGGESAGFASALGDLRSIFDPPRLATLLDSIEDNPDLARWTTEIAQRDAAVAVEKSLAIPSLTVGIGGRQFTDNGDKALVAGLSIPLPIFDRNQGNILAADRKREQAAAARTRARVAVHRELVAAYEDLRAAYAQAMILREQVLPKAERAFAESRENYERGFLRFLDVLDAQRTLFESRDQYIQTLAAYHSAAADVVRLSGQPLSDGNGEEQR